jgi:hypothetical protein
VDDIETFVRSVEKESGNHHLTVIDIPFSEEKIRPERTPINGYHSRGVISWAGWCVPEPEGTVF